MTQPAHFEKAILERRTLQGKIRPFFHIRMKSECRPRGDIPTWELSRCQPAFARRYSYVAVGLTLKFLVCAERRNGTILALGSTASGFLFGEAIYENRLVLEPKKTLAGNTFQATTERIKSNYENAIQRSIAA